MKACEFGHTEVAELLLNRGATVDKQNPVRDALCRVSCISDQIL
jgi:hypothetical protein